MNTATWEQINDALMKNGIKTNHILMILLALPKSGNRVKSNDTIYNRQELYGAVMSAYPFNFRYRVRLVSALNRHLWG